MMRRLAWVVLACVVLLAVCAEVVAVRSGEGVDLPELAFLSFPVVGTFIVSRQPRNAIGWIMLGIGAAGALSQALVLYAYYGLTVRPGSLPAAEFALAINSPLWVPFIGLSGTFLILLFPDGQLPSPRWRGWAYFCTFALILSYTVILILPASFADVGYPHVANPLGVDALKPVIGAVVSVVVLIPIAVVGCAIALIRRFRRSHGLARLQMKWFAAAAAMVATAYLILMGLHFAFGDPDPPWLAVVSDIGILAFVLLPVAVGIAIFRHRLYAIDVIINRTLVYGALTATLTGTYFAFVTALQDLLRPLAGHSDLAVAASTLVVAAIFRPARHRIQALVDRRFYRSKVDAETTLHNFSGRLRHQVDLDALTDDLLELANATMQPTHVSLWLRPATAAATDARVGEPQEARSAATRR